MSIPIFFFLLSVLVRIQHVSPVNGFPKNGGIFYPELNDYTKEFLCVKKQEIRRDKIKDLELFPKNLPNLIENSTLEGLKHRGINVSGQYCIVATVKVLYYQRTIIVHMKSTGLYIYKIR